MTRLVDKGFEDGVVDSPLLRVVDAEAFLEVGRFEDGECSGVGIRLSRKVVGVAHVALKTVVLLRGEVGAAKPVEDSEVPGVIPSQELVLVDLG